jgi:ribosomal protein S18 acetylase RimI-like enzyme
VLPTPLHVRASRADEHGLAEALADILIDCIDGGATVTFLAPMPRPKALAFWQRVIDSAERGERLLLVAEDDTGHVHGTVQLALSMPENQPHRAEIVKLLVHRRARGAGVGTTLMRAAEHAARAAGRTLLVLDTATGGAAERLYTRLGWHRLGVIPDYALSPDATTYGGATFFYKQLL